MNENAIKNYATWARRELMAEVERRCALFGISDEKDCPYDAESVGGRILSSEERRMRRELVGEARRGMPALVERAAYTWFNRMLAIRFMECNDRLPSQTRMFSATDGSFAPQALKEALSVEIDGIDRQRVASLVQGGDDEALFRYLLLLQCDELAECMPAVFDKVGEDPLVLLLPDGLLRSEGVVGKLVTDISEDDWRDGVQIVGWMYQFYISEKKDEFFASKRKASAEDIPAATQLFTPEWIVQYLVQNSLGRLWMLNRPSSRLAERMEYFITPDVDAHEEFQHVGSPEEITLIDPACGSGHILVYAFDLLAAIYEECGYSRRDIPRLILEKNLTGIEIDRRAGALASFALMMKACEYDGRFLRRGVRPKITVLEKIELGQEHVDAINAVRAAATKDGEPFLLDQVDLLDALAHLDEVGSLFAPTEDDMAALRAAARELESSQGLFGMGAAEIISKAIQMLEPLRSEYPIVVANPPYMKSGDMNRWLVDWLETNNEPGKYDLCASFIVRNLLFAAEAGFVSMITMQSWMTIPSAKNLRRLILDTAFINNLALLGPHAFDSISGEVVTTACFTIQNLINDASQHGFYVDLTSGNSESEKKNLFLATPANRVQQSSFESIDDYPIICDMTDAAADAFAQQKKFSEVAFSKPGMQTSDNERFLRMWYEIDYANTGFELSHEEAASSHFKWFPYNKGDGYRKWYGNCFRLVNFKNDGEEIKYWLTHNPNDPTTTSWSRNMRNYDSYFVEGITYTAIGGNFSARCNGPGYLFDTKGPTIFSEMDLKTLCAYVNSSSFDRFNRMLTRQLTKSSASINGVPYIAPELGVEDLISEISSGCIELAKADWNSFETSWDFKSHPLVGWSHALWDVTSIGATMHHFYGCHPEVGSPLELCYMLWQGQCRERFDRLKSNEEELNRIFARIYGMEGEVPIEVPDDKVSVRLADKTRDVKSLISYAVGCMLGRYSLDVEGLVLANQGDGLAEYLAKVPEPTFMPDDDGIIPITDTEYFHDDATGLFVDFVRAVYGADTLEENLAFVAAALGGSGTPREAIRDYFMNGFFADHCKVYQKRPIYWLFDSGKKGGYRALVYMHRYRPDLLAKLRTDYVHEQQDRYRTQIEHIDDAMEAADRRQQAELKKRRKKLSEQLAEISTFEEKVHHLADQMIEIDLDDGVKANYAKFQDVLAKIK